MSIDPIFKLIEERKENEAIKYVLDGCLANVDCIDNHGTTTLQYAAFRGCINLCKLLLQKGADVNTKTNTQGYSALMFAAISNNCEIVQLLLEHGADVEAKNLIGKTSSEMAAFVNSHEAVDIINNYIPISALDFFSKYPEDSPLLSKKCVEHLHSIIISTNFNPIYIIKLIKKSNQILMPNVKSITSVLDQLITKAFKPSEDKICPNDIVAFRMHYYKFIFEYLRKQIEAFNTKNNIKNIDNGHTEKLFDFIIKKFLIEDKNQEKESFYKFEEEFLRESIRTFPYHECALVKQMAQILVKIKIGSSPSALSILNDCLNGQKLGGASETESKNFKCKICHRLHSKLCTGCHKIAYCDKYCQKLDWGLGHKNECKSI